MKPRRWQKEAADKCVHLVERKADRALIYACPGSGKTWGGLFIASELRRRTKLGPKIIVLTPNLAIKSQWIARAAQLNLELRPLVDARRQLLQNELELTDSGLVISYQQVINCRTALQYFCDTHHPIVILDEVHHTEGPRADHDGNRWGASVEMAFSKASFKLCTTGTPFRQGNQPISFVHYNESGEVNADHTYTYSSAIIDGVCRAIEFQIHDGEIEWHDGSKLVTADFTTPLTKKQERQRLRAAISTEGDFTTNMLRNAHERLLELRAGSGVDSRAAGLVVAENTKHADEIALELEAISGKRPTVVHNKIDDSIGEIDRFREGDDMWIVGVAMISEGVDIPRLRVGVYATNVTAPLYFHQFCGRFARVMESRDERSFIWVPNDPELTAIALQINEERYHALGEASVENVTRIGRGGRRKRDIEVEDSDSELIGKAMSGARFDSAVIKQHRSSIDGLRLNNPTCRHMPDAEILKIMLDMGVIKNLEPAT